jgi:hypothetical protein
MRQMTAKGEMIWTQQPEEPDEAPEIPPDEPQPAPVQDPPAEPDQSPYVVRTVDGRAFRNESTHE